MTLFIGGPLDGKLIEVEPLRKHVEVAIQHDLEQVSPKTPKTLTDIFYYKKQVLECPTAQLEVFVPRSYSCVDLLNALIQGYHRGAIQNTNESS